MKSLDFANLQVFNKLRMQKLAIQRWARPGNTDVDITGADMELMKTRLAFSTGNHYYVDSVTGSNGNPGTKDLPKATIDQGLNLITSATEYSTVVVLPGHTEDTTVSNAFNMDVANSRIVGLGQGSAQATVTFDDEADDAKISAANCHIEGIHFLASVTNTSIGVNVQNGADDFSIVGCRFSAEALTTDEFIDAISVTTADRGIIAYNTFDMDDQTGAASAIHLVGAILGCKIYGNYIEGDYSVACIEHMTSAAEMITIEDNTLINGSHAALNTLAVINVTSTTTGIIQRNECYTNVTAPLTGAIVAAAMFHGSGNSIQSTAEVVPFQAEGGLNGIIQTDTCITKADVTDGLGLFTVLGVIDIWGIRQTATTAASNTPSLGVQLDATVEGFNTTFVTDSALTAETTIGDFAVADTAGGAFTVRQVETPTTNDWLWNTAIRCPAGVIEQAASGTSGNLVSSYTIFWSEVSVGATVIPVA